LKNSLGFFGSALRQLPLKHRWKLLRHLFPLMRSQSDAPAAQVCIFDSLQRYEASYAQLASMLGPPAKRLPDGEIEFLDSMAHRQTWYPGAVGPSDFFFLTGFLGVLDPLRVVEIGTLTGFSAVMIAAALNRRHGFESNAVVDTIDTRVQCFIDETKPTGFEISQLIPELSSMIRLHVPQDATYLEALARPNELKVVFIDADHRHPRVLLDLLRVAPYVEQGGWILLHDIRLGTIGHEMKAAGQPTPFAMPFGAQWLFERWPYRKISGGNIGAVQLPDDKRELIPFALHLMSIPFEIEGKQADRACTAIYQSFEKLL
jgi:predicted O-methyltransferase YrrM